HLHSSLLQRWRPQTAAPVAYATLFRSDAVAEGRRDRLRSGRRCIRRIGREADRIGGHARLRGPPVVAAVTAAAARGQQKNRQHARYTARTEHMMHFCYLQSVATNDLANRRMLVSTERFDEVSMQSLPLVP